jgi:NAD(P)-dependent dehydrogenase (short-subunit alcohol dehydrogenase family)
VTGLLDGKTAVLTGAGDIGGAIARELVRHGARLRVWDRDEAALQRLADDGIDGERVNVTSAAELAAAAARAITDFDHVDVLVASAAVLGELAPVATMAEDEWRRVLDVNLTGVFLTCRAFAQHMADCGSGCIVNISSVGGLSGEPEIAHYCASKFGVIGLSQSLADELGPYGVRVNCVCPGAVDSSMNDRLMEMYAERTGGSVDEFVSQLVGLTAMRRLVTPEDVARVVVLLASDLAGFVTREAVPVTGGLRF